MNRKVKFLLDSGAVLSVMTEKTDHKLVGATGHDLRVLGVAKDVSTKLGELQFWVNFIVVKT